MTHPKLPEWLEAERERRAQEFAFNANEVHGEANVADMDSDIFIYSQGFNHAASLLLPKLQKTKDALDRIEYDCTYWTGQEEKENLIQRCLNKAADALEDIERPKGEIAD